MSAKSVKSVAPTMELEERLERRFRYERALTLVSQILRRAPDLSSGLNEALPILLEASGSDRVYIFENSDDPVNGLCSNHTYECCQPGIEPQIDNPDLKNLPYAVVSPSGYLLDCFYKREPVRGPVNTLPEAEREVLEMQQIVDILILPIYAGEIFWGFLGFDDCQRVGNFDDDDVALLQNTADIIGWHVAARRANEELEQRVALRTAELAARNNEMQGLLRAIPDTVILCDHEGAIISASLPRVSDRSRFLATDDDIRPDYSPRFREVLATMHGEMLIQRGSHVREFEFGDSDAPVYIEARATPVGNDRMLLLLRDVSSRRHAEREVASSLARQRQLAEMKAQFVAVASHEFRTPLAAAIGSIDLIEKHKDRLTAEKRDELTQRIRRSLDRLADIMQGITNTHLSDSGRAALKLQPVALSAIVRSLIDEAAEKDHHQHVIRLESVESNIVIHSDPRMLREIVLNLLHNALLYSAAGSTVVVALTMDGPNIAIKICDEGIGIPLQDRERVFEPFERGTNIGAVGGIGLGLTIAQRNTESLGGRIVVVPSDRGTVFEVRLPFSAPTPG